MQTIALALALFSGSALAFAPVQTTAPTRVIAAEGAKDDLIALAEANTDLLSPGFWDPLGATEIDFWGLGQEGVCVRAWANELVIK